jgi:hypothetical protein
VCVSVNRRFTLWVHVVGMPYKLYKTHFSNQSGYLLLTIQLLLSVFNSFLPVLSIPKVYLKKVFPGIFNESSFFSSTM